MAIIIQVFPGGEEEREGDRSASAPVESPPSPRSGISGGFRSKQSDWSRAFHEPKSLDQSNGRMILEAEIRFSVVLHLYSLIHKSYLRIHANCLDNDCPLVPSVSSVFPAANWHERETFDMFGIKFSEHPNLKRILMWDDYPYFPLRKEFPLAGVEVPLPAADVSEVTGADVDPAPMMGGPFVSPGTGRMSNAEPRAKDESWSEDAEKPL